MESRSYDKGNWERSANISSCHEDFIPTIKFTSLPHVTSRDSAADWLKDSITYELTFTHKLHNNSRWY
ncbi:hypothetical protein RIR_jg40967.t1 [Rhizophagus irregularis DAOM 181602=DAOM 197198]|nr:hypothetical protein RIR_jg40967.t1 [Rhizophagus irregularis DAOM 181602=DAOM 197198]